MGTTWILVVRMKTGELSIAELDGEAAAFAAYEAALATDYADLYLAPLRLRAHRVSP